MPAMETIRLFGWYLRPPSLISKVLKGDSMKCDKGKDHLHKAKQFMENNNPEEGEKLIAQAVRLGQDDPQTLRIWIRSAWRQGKYSTAQRRAKRSLQLQPDDSSLFLLAIQLQAETGRPLQALMRLNKALAKGLSGARPRLLKLELLQRLGRTRPALNVLYKLRHRWPNLEAVSIAAAQFYRAHGRYRAAEKVLNRLLERQPNHRQARVMRRSLVGPLEANLPITSLLERVKNVVEVSVSDAAELLRAVEVTTAPELAPVCCEAVDVLSDLDGIFKESGLFSLFQQAERFKRHGAAERALRGILTSGPRDVTVARALLRKAITSLESQQHDVAMSRLLLYIPYALHASLEEDFIFWTEGAQAAIDKRQRKGRRRTRQEALKLSRILKRGRSCCLALRYLRFCYRTWPDSPDVRIEYATVLVDLGQPETALTILSGSFPATKWVQVASQRARALLEAGRLQDAKTELEKAHARKLDNAISSVLLRILISQGQEESAKALVKEVKERGLHRGVGSDHLTPSLYGNLLSDLSLCRAEQAALPPGKHDEYLAVRYVHVASNFIENVSEWDNTVPIKGSIPWQIVQYWDDPHPPKGVADIMYSWASCSGFEYVCFNSRMARAFLRSSFGADYERAFRRANNVAEGADFFRLCYLRRYGGIYADADDQLYGSLKSILPTNAGMVCFREPFGILANNFIACRPDHPAITLASELALDALLSNDNESTWSKTGPGLLTRAVASYLTMSDIKSSEDQVAILPQYLLRQQVRIHIELPHKSSGRHWNTNGAIAGVNMRALFSSTLVDS